MNESHKNENAPERNTNSRNNSFSSVFFQPKLSVNTPGDSYEQEADAMADKVIRMKSPEKADTFFSPSTSTIQRKCAGCEEDEKVHRKETSGSETQGNSELDGYVSTLSSSGKPLSESSRQFFEPRFGQDFSNVKIHTDSVAAKSAQSINALAYTTGNNIVFNQGQYSPNSDSGQKLMAHELTHVVQQSNAPKKIQRVPAPTLGGPLVLTTSLSTHFKINHPNEQELDAEPSVVLTPSGLLELSLLSSRFLSNPAPMGQIEGNASIEGPADFNQALSQRRALWLARKIGIQHVDDVPGNPSKCTPGTITGLHGCGTLNAGKTTDVADRNAKVTSFFPPSPANPTLPQTPIPQPTNPTTPKTPQTPTEPTTPGPSTPTPAPTKSGDQGSVQPGIGGVVHHYTTPAGPSAPLKEWVTQATFAYTHLFHGNNKSGPELQFPIQVQYSLTTKQWSVLGGAQGTYSISLPNDFTIGLFAQLLAGTVIKGPEQVQPALGAQISWQPVDWLNLGIQGTGSVTGSKGGPTSLDAGGVFLITIQGTKYHP